MDWIKALDDLYLSEEGVCDCCARESHCYHYKSNFYRKKVLYCLDCMLQDINDWLAQSCDVVLQSPAKGL